VVGGVPSSCDHSIAPMDPAGCGSAGVVVVVVGPVVVVDGAGEVVRLVVGRGATVVGRGAGGAASGRAPGAGAGAFACPDGRIAVVPLSMVGTAPLEAGGGGGSSNSAGATTSDLPTMAPTAKSAPMHRNAANNTISRDIFGAGRRFFNVISVGVARGRNGTRQQRGPIQ
jgi:hypothetical protein